MSDRFRAIHGQDQLYRQNFYDHGGDSFRLNTLVFMSEATFDLGLMGVLHLFSQAYRNNLELRITGALYYDGKEFYQIMEGEPDALDDLWLTIKHDYRHQNIKMLSQNGISIRAYKNWSMYVKDGASMALGFPQYRNLIGELTVKSVRDLSLHF